MGGRKKFVPKWKNQSCSKLPEMARKIDQNGFSDFWTPPPTKKKCGDEKKFGQKCKNQSCFKLPEMARKLIKIDFRIFDPSPRFLPPKKWNMGTKKNLVKNEKIKVVLDCLKWQENGQKWPIKPIVWEYNIERGHLRCGRQVKAVCRR